MTLLSRIGLKQLSLVLLFAFVATLFYGHSAMAYTCAKSGPDGSGKVGQYELRMEGTGSCYYLEPDSVNNTERHMQFGAGGVPLDANGDGKQDFTCTGGTVPHDDGNCYAYKKTYTNYKPTYDDGTEIPDSVFQSACEQQPSFYGGHWNYNAERNACEAWGNCTGAPDSWSMPQGCRKVGDGTKGAEDVLGTDTTVNKNPNGTQETCTDGSTPDPSTGKCADGSTPGSQAPITPNSDPDKDFETCGEAETTLISCSQNDCPGSTGPFEGAPVIGCVLRFAIQALTVIIGIAAVGGIAWEAVQYARAQDDQSVVSNARSRIRDILIGLIVYLFMIAVINWLVPGTVIK